MSDIETMLMDKIKLNPVVKIAAVISEEGDQSESPTVKVWHAFDDLLLDTASDSILKRRIMSSQTTRRFDQCVLDLKRCLGEEGDKSRAFIINIVCPKYESNKDMVELILNTALLGVSDLDSNASQEEIVEDIANRYYQTRRDFIDDVDVTEFNNRHSEARDMNVVVARHAERAFFGEPSYSSRDPRNALYTVVQYWKANPLREDAPQMGQISDEDINESTRHSVRNNELGSAPPTVDSEATEPEHHTFHTPPPAPAYGAQPAQISSQGARYNIGYKKKSRADWVAHSVNEIEDMRQQPGSSPFISAYPGLMPTERPDFFLRYDLDRPESLTWLYRGQDEVSIGNKTVLQVENDGLQRMRRLIDFGLKGKHSLIPKWHLYTRILAAVQGVPQVSLFHEGGFRDEVDPRTGNVVSYGPHRRGTMYGPEDMYEPPEITDQEVDSVIDDFMLSLTEGSPFLVSLSDSLQEGASQRSTVSGEQTSEEEPPAEASSDIEKSESNNAKSISEEINRRVDFDVDSPINPDTGKHQPRAYPSEQHKANARNVETIRVLARMVKNHFGDQIPKLGRVKAFLKERGRGTASYAEEFSSQVYNYLRHSNVVASAPSEEFIKTSALHRRITDKQLSSHIREKFRSIYEERDESIPGTFIEHLQGLIRHTTPHAKVSSKATKAVIMEYLLQSFVSYLQKMIESDDSSDSDMDQNRMLSASRTIPEGVAPDIIVPFGKEVQRGFGINVNNPGEAEQQFYQLFSSGATVYIIGDSTRDRLEVRTARICDAEGRDRMYSVDGPFCKIRFNPSVAPENTYSGNYRLYIPPIGNRQKSSLKGLKSSLYGEIYGDSAKRMMDLHASNGVELSCSIYPWWAPSQYDYRERVEEEGGVGEVVMGHPNNAYNIKRQLNKCVKARSYLESRASLDKKHADYYRQSIAQLDRAIREMRIVLFHWHHGQEENALVADKEKKLVKDNSSSMLRDIRTSKLSEEMGDGAMEEWEETIRESDRQGLNVGFMNQYLNLDVFPHFFSPADRRRFKGVRQAVAEKYKTRKSLFVLRSADALLSSDNRSNGFFTLVDRPPAATPPRLPGGEEGPKQPEREIVWGTGFSSAVVQLYNTARQHKITKSHIILISSEPLPPIKELGEGVMAHVVIPTETIGREEIKEIIDYFEEKIRNEIVSSKNYSEEMRQRAKSFAIPSSFVRQIQASLTNLSFDVVVKYIETKLKDFLAIYMPSNVSMVQVVDSQLLSIKQECNNMRSEDSTLRSLNIRSTPPRFTVDEYVTNKGMQGEQNAGQWAAHVETELKGRVDRINRIRKIMDLLQRAVDDKIGFGTYTITDDNVIKFDVSMSSHAPGTVWFPLNADGPVTDFNFDESNSIITDLAKLAGYSITQTVSAALRKDGLKNVTYDASNLSACESFMNQKLASLEADIANEKRSYPVMTILEGSPGTGKSIFAEVLASSLDCRYLSTTLNQIVNSGTPELRGGSEKNMIKFLELCRTLTDTVLLIDEIDRFLITSNMSGASDDVQRVLEMLQSRWDQSGDYPLYRAHNLHIVSTTNNMEQLIQRTGALVTRMQQHTVELPSDEQTLKQLFIGKAARNNLMNLLCGDDVALAQMAKELLEIYDIENPDQNVLAYRNSLERRILHANPRFFSEATILRPRQAHAAWLSTMGLTLRANVVPIGMARESSVTLQSDRFGFTKLLSDILEPVGKRFSLHVNCDNPEEVILTSVKKNTTQEQIEQSVKSAVEYIKSVGIKLKTEPSRSGASWKLKLDTDKIAIEKDINHVQDFVDGWNQVMVEFKKANVQVDGTDNGVPTKFNPLSMACKRMSEIMTIQGPVTRRKYAATSLRELMVTIKDMFESHQRFMTGDTKSLPFNWKVFLTTFLATSYRPKLDRNIVDEKDWTPAFQASLAARERSDGYEKLKVFAGVVSPYEGCPPIQAFCTREQFEQMERRKDEAVMTYSADPKKGEDMLVENTKNKLYLGSSYQDFESKLNVLCDRMKSEAAQKNPEGILANDFLDIYTSVRNEIKSILQQIESKKEYDEKLHDQLIEKILTITHEYEKNASYIRSIHNAFFIQPKVKDLEATFKQIEIGISGLKSSYSVANAIISSGRIEESINARWNDAAEQARAALAKDRSMQARSYFSPIYGEVGGDITKALMTTEPTRITRTPEEEIRRKKMIDQGNIAPGAIIPDQIKQTAPQAQPEAQAPQAGAPTTQTPAPSAGPVEPIEGEGGDPLGGIDLTSASSSDVKTSTDYFYNFLVKSRQEAKIKAAQEKAQTTPVPVPIPAAVSNISKETAEIGASQTGVTTKDPMDAFVLDPRLPVRINELHSSLKSWCKKNKQAFAEPVDNEGFMQLFRNP